ncbi:MAG: hypothetical protein IKZ89_05625 [Bacteroidaceae bacterium]|nr:hypothetical protein [Bacteroidaceae bacterium]
MKKILLSILVMMAGISPALSQETLEKKIVLEEVQIEALSNKTIINKAIGNLKKRIKESITFGNGQLTQIMEANGSVVQLSREYGYFFANGYSDKMANKFDGGWYLNFVPVYNARSLRYEMDGKNVLPASYANPEEPSPWNNHYDARARYMFDILRVIYLFGPIYSRNYSDYVFKCTDITDDSYVFSFESSDRYPQKNPLYAKGNLEIEMSSMKLTSIRIERMGIHFAGRCSTLETQLERYSDYHDEKILQDCIDCDFKVKESGDINYALIHLQWNPSMTQYYKGGRGKQPRANVVGTDFIVTECWKTEPFKTPDTKSDNKKRLGKLKEKILINALIGLGKSPENNSYNPEAIAKINWAFDVSDAERQLSKKMPIQEQYKLQSKDYYSSEEEMLVKHELGFEPRTSPQKEEAKKNIHEYIRNNLFKDPLR